MFYFLCFIALNGLARSLMTDSENRSQTEPWLMSDMKSAEDLADRTFVLGETPNPMDFEFDCTNIASIAINHNNVIGKGVSKRTFFGKHNSKSVAVKMVTPEVQDVKDCIKRLNTEHKWNSSYRDKYHQCYAFPNMKLMKEILLLVQLNHPNLVKLLGYCVRSEETESLLLSDHGIIAAYEYALPVLSYQIKSWSYGTKLRSALELADLLTYLEHSPLGSLILADLKRSHLLLRSPHSIVITDLDDVNSIEPTCLPQDSGSNFTAHRHPVCPFGIPCRNNSCHGYNAKHNLSKLFSLVLSKLLFCEPVNEDNGLPRDIKLGLVKLCNQLKNNQLTAMVLKDKLTELVSRQN